MGVPIPHNPGKEAGNYDRQIAELKRQIAQIMELIGKAGSVDMNAIGRKFISIEFFNQIFAIHGKTEEPEETEEVEATEVTEEGEGGEEEESDIIKPNTIAEVGSIEAKAGFWTESYIDALGNGGTSGGGGGGAAALYECADVKRDGDKVYGAEPGKALVYGDDGHWYAGNVTADLTNYATKAWVQGQGYLVKAVADGYYLGKTATAEAAKKLATARTLWGQSFDGTQNVTGNMSSVGNISFEASGKNIGGIAYFDTTNSRLGIGAAPGAYKLDVSGQSHFSGDIHIGAAVGSSPLIYWGDGTYCYIGEVSDDKLHLYGSSGIHLMGGNVGVGTTSPSYKLDVSGIIHVTTGLIADGYVDALSDIRKKDVVKDFCLDVDKIALARLIQFTWKDGHDKDIHAGGVAQEWQKILPEAVHESADGTLSMDYGVIGMVSSVSLARKVVEQQKEIDNLKSRLEKIEKLLEERL